MMTDEQILELAEKLKFCLRDEDDWRNWKVSPSLILEFARAIRQNGYDEGYDEGCVITRESLGLDNLDSIFSSNED